MTGTNIYFNDYKDLVKWMDGHESKLELYKKLNLDIRIEVGRDTNIYLTRQEFVKMLQELKRCAE